MVKYSIKTLGSDPEFLIRDKNTGLFVSSDGIIPGDKNDPEDLKELGKGFSLQKDNVLAELCVPYSETGEGLYDNISKAMEYINQEVLPDHLELATVTGGEYDDESISTPFAQLFGCSPSYNAWTRDSNMVPPNTSNYRGAGFHIHVGYDDHDPMTTLQLVQAFDLFGGIPSVLFDSDSVRRKQYGQAGEFRLTPFGFELRILGGYVMSNKKYFDSAIRAIEKSFEFVNQGKEFTDEEAMNIQLCINNHDVELANELVEKFEIQELVEPIKELV